MYRYMIIETKNKPIDSWSIVTDFLSDLIYISGIETTLTQLIVFYDSMPEVPLKEMVYNIIAETYIDLRLYESHTFDDIQSRNTHLNYIKKQLEFIPTNSYTYLNNFHLLRYHLEHHLHIEPQYFLGKYTLNSEMIQTIKTFLEHNQNINQTAKELYIHRNTLLQRLDKFYQVTGFDVKKFQDAFIVYQLI
jgi:RNA-binding protein YhbY